VFDHNDKEDEEAVKLEEGQAEAEPKATTVKKHSSTPFVY
jgi:hypothetical protein